MHVDFSLFLTQFGLSCLVSFGVLGMDVQAVFNRVPSVVCAWAQQVRSRRCTAARKIGPVLTTTSCRLEGEVYAMIILRGFRVTEEFGFGGRSLAARWVPFVGIGGT